MKDKNCPFCNKPMKKNKSYFGKQLKAISRENLPLSISDNTILHWYECWCTQNKDYKGICLGHNRLYLNGELYLYYCKWYKFSSTKTFIFR
jgi:hypothetical protein